MDTKVETILAQNPNEVEVDRAAKEGDIVNIDFKGTKDGEAFEGGFCRGSGSGAGFR